MKKLLLILVFLILTLVGLIFLVFTITTRVPWLGLLGEAHRTTGTVVKINNWTESGESYTSPQVEFITEDGQEISVDMLCPPLDCYADYEIGSKVGVIYPRNFPEMAIADTLMGRLGTLLVMLVISLVFVVVGSVGIAYVISDWREVITISRSYKT